MGKKLLFACLLAAVTGTAALAQSGTPIAPVTQAYQSWSEVEASAKAQAAVYSAMGVAYSAQGAAFNAQASMYAAQQAAEKAKIGSVSGSLISSSVESTNVSDVADAKILISQETRDAAAAAAIRIKTNSAARGAGAVILGDLADIPTAEALYFDQQKLGSDSLFPDAQREFTRVQALDAAYVPPRNAGSSSGSTRSANFTTAGATLDAVAKLASYFSASYGFANISSVDPEAADVPRYMAEALMSTQLVKGTTYGPLNNVYLAGSIPANGLNVISSDFNTMQARYIEAVAGSAICKERSALLKKINDPNAHVLAAKYERVDVALTKVTQSFESLVQWMGAKPEGTATANIVKLVRGKMLIQTAGANGLFLQTSVRGLAANYTKKDIWSIFGGPPLWVKGGVVLTYQLVEFNTGKVVDAGTVTESSGYKKVLKIQ